MTRQTNICTVYTNTVMLNEGTSQTAEMRAENASVSRTAGDEEQGTCDEEIARSKPNSYTDDYTHAQNRPTNSREHARDQSQEQRSCERDRGWKPASTNTRKGNGPTSRYPRKRHGKPATSHRCKRTLRRTKAGSATGQRRRTKRNRRSDRRNSTRRTGEHD